MSSDVSRPAGVLPGSLWRHGDFAKLWTGQTVSVLGSQITPLALPLTAAVTLRASPGEMGWLRVAEYLPPVLVGLVAGVWVDRLRRRPILIWTDLIRALILLGVPAAAAIGLLRMELLYGVAVAMGILGAVFGVAAAAYLPSLVPSTSLLEANAKLETGNSVAYVVGPGIAGVLIQVLTAPGAIAVDGLTFLASALGVAAIRTPEQTAPPREKRRRLWVEIGEGLRTVAYSPILRPFVVSSAAYDVCWNAVAAVYFLYLTRELALAPAAFGLIIGVGSVGGLVESVVAGEAARRIGLGRVIVGSQFLLGASGLLIPLAASLPALALALLVLAEVVQLFMNSVYSVNRASLELLATPDRLRGRVRASRSVIGAAAVTLGAALGGVLGERIGMGATTVLGTCGGALAFIWLWTSPIRRLHDAPALEPLVDE